MTHICVGNLTIIGSDNGLSPGRRQAIIWTNAGILLRRPLGTNFSEFLVEILIFSFKKMRLKVSSAKRRPFCLGLNVLTVKVCAWRSNCMPLLYMDVLTLLCLISTPHPHPHPRIIATRYQLYDFDKHTPSNKSSHLPLSIEVWISQDMMHHHNASPYHDWCEWYEFND